jgi:hypothetical protein
MLTVAGTLLPLELSASILIVDVPPNAVVVWLRITADV